MSVSDYTAGYFFHKSTRLFSDEQLEVCASVGIVTVVSKAGVGRGKGIGAQDVERVVQLPVHLAHPARGVEEALQHILKNPRHPQRDGHALQKKKRQTIHKNRRGQEISAEERKGGYAK